MPTIAKRNGIHYTPTRLADFLASQLCGQLKGKRGTISILDPACGDGGLLTAIVKQFPQRVIRRLRLVGYELDKSAARIAQSRLSKVGVQWEIHTADFLDSKIKPEFDAVISNPPYVRTQVIGAERAQQLGQQYGLSGRVDLYQAFTIAMTHALREGGRLALLTSNRFMTTRSGNSLRRFLLSQFDLQSVLDLGDTRLFSAAVLPVIVIGKKQTGQHNQTDHPTTEFTRVYSSDLTDETIDFENKSVLDAVGDKFAAGVVSTADGNFSIERGTLQTVGKEQTWTLVNREKRKWLDQLRSKQFCTFGDVAEIRVGIKTTADSVFVRDDWNELEPSLQPERKLLRRLITHHDAQRWSIGPPRKTVLYPHMMQDKRRVAIDLSKHEKAARYFELHRNQLESRTYVAKSGRKWFEIWVPQNPSDWAAPKIVWPDISEQARFFYDETGAIVNGDCYWIKLKPDVDPDWLMLMLAVGNSTVALNFYDTLFHNQLYANRRRFMTQYVRQFPLPDVNSSTGKQIVELVRKQLQKTCENQAENERNLSRIVAQAFGLDSLADGSRT